MKNFDRGSIAVIAITVMLFVYAVIRHGLTDDLLLETGIFLVSVKIIMLSYENGRHIRHIESQLEGIHEGISRVGGGGAGGDERRA